MAKHPIPEAALDGSIAIVGKTGKGKSIVAKGIAERLLDKKRRVVVIDIMGHWWGLKSSADGKEPGYPIAVFGGAHADIPIDRTSGKKLAGVLAREPIPAVVDVSEMRKTDWLHMCVEFFEEIYRLNRSLPLTLILEEADALAPQTTTDGGDAPKLLGEIDRIARRGRAYGFRLVTITQRPARLHKDVLSQAGTLVALGVTAPQDRDALKAWVDGNGDRDQAKAVYDSLAKLQTGEGWVWHPDDDHLERVKFPMIKTLDTSKTPKAGEKGIEPKRLASADIVKLTKLLQPEPQPAPSAKGAKPDKAAPAKPTGPMITVAEHQRRLHEAVAAASQREYQRGYEQSRKEFRNSLTDVERRLRDILAKSVGARDLLGKRLEENDKALQMILAGVGTLKNTIAEAKAPAGPPATVARVQPQPSRQVVHSVPNGDAGDHRVSSYQQKILDALAWLETIGMQQPEKDVAAHLAAVSPTSSTYGNNLAMMKNAGLIDYPQPGFVALTDAGRAIATPPERMATRAELHDNIRRRLSDYQCKLFDALIEIYPESIQRGDLSVRADVSGSSSTFGNNLAMLKNMGLVEYPSLGAVQASRLLFPEGLS